jgi:hypothetical protein
MLYNQDGTRVHLYLPNNNNNEEERKEKDSKKSNA